MSAEADDPTKELVPYLTDPNGQEHYLNTEITTIGRAVESDIVITSKRVSREHARLLREGRRVFIEDLESTNGTLLNSERIAKAEVRDGDNIAIGEVVFTFHDPDSTYADAPSLDLEINLDAGVVRMNRRVVSLSPKEYALLGYLYQHRGKVCPKEDIALAVWPEYKEGIFDYQIENLMRRLRSRLEPDPANAQMLLTIRGQGYKLVTREP